MAATATIDRRERKDEPAGPSVEAPLEIVRTEDLDPNAFLQLVRTDPAGIKRARIEPPRLGGQGYGRIRVEYVVPRLRKRA